VQRLRRIGAGGLDPGLDGPSASAKAARRFSSARENGSRLRNTKTGAASPIAISTCGKRSAIDSSASIVRNRGRRSEITGGSTGQVRISTM